MPQPQTTQRGDEFFTTLASRPPFSRLDPALAAFFKDYLSHEKAVPFGNRTVINSHFPPYPSRAFESFLEQFFDLGKSGPKRRLYSVTLAVTNRCGYRCWHCYNAGRSQKDMSLEALCGVAAQLQGLGAVCITLSGGEPLLRADLEDIVGAFDDRSCLVLNTTGDGLTPTRARALRERGLFAAGISLDSADEAEHDRLRDRPGAFRAALDALRTAGSAGLYPYVVSVATREFLQPDRFRRFSRFVEGAGAREIHLLEPTPAGRLAGRSDVVLADAERELLVQYQREAAARDDGPVLSSFAYLESDGAFGCGAGLTHLYIDGSGEVCPCNLVPLSFGNVGREGLRAALDRMGKIFRLPRLGCIGRLVAGHLPPGAVPAPPEVSEAVCARCLPREHPLPRFFRAREEAAARRGVGSEELRDAYDRVHGNYDASWLSEAAGPVNDLVDRMAPAGALRVFEAGCGTGYGTVRLFARLDPAGPYLAVDLSKGMIEEARRRLEAAGLRGVRFETGDALEALRRGGPYDLVFTSWVLGYIPLRSFFAAAAGALAPGGRLAFVVHHENSPREPLEIFSRLVAEDPSVLRMRVDFDFPRDKAHVRAAIEAAELEVIDLWDGTITFRCASPAAVLEHLLTSGAGTAYYDALDPARRPSLERRFIEDLGARHAGAQEIPVAHDYILEDEGGKMNNKPVFFLHPSSFLLDPNGKRAGMLRIPGTVFSYPTWEHNPGEDGTTAIHIYFGLKRIGVVTISRGWKRLGGRSHDKPLPRGAGAVGHG
jgi:MoaA/NifB/PqqE/SkfB family radical SAM enzyme/SAM-dependent methyltransferase